MPAMTQPPTQPREWPKPWVHVDTPQYTGFAPTEDVTAGAQQPPQQFAPVGQPPQKSFWKTTPGILAIAATAIGVIGSAATLAIGGLPGPSDEDKAVEHCQESVVRPQLRSPSSAKFLGARVDHEAGTELFHVTGQLDAQNGFGAMIRGQYSCNMRYENGAWTVIGQSVT